MKPSAAQVAEGKAQHKYVVQHTLAKASLSIRGWKRTSPGSRKLLHWNQRSLA